MATHSKDVGANNKAATGFASDPEGSSETRSAKKAKGKSKFSSVPKSKTLKEKHQKKSVRKSANKSASVIPSAVSNRMIRRVLVITGIPTVVSFTILPLSVIARNREWFELPTNAVFAGSLGFLILGFLGITYSLLSASWDEDVPGSVLGITELKLNWKRFREAKQVNQK